MKKIKLLFVSALASAFVFLGGASAPVVAFAEEPESEAVTSEITSIEEVVEGTESVENESEEEEETKLDFDDILEFAGTLAEKEGWGDEWEKALYYIENAATEKKVELMTVFIILVFIFLVADRTVKLIRWLQKRKKDTTSKDLQDIKTASGQQTTAINDLIDEEEKVDMHVTDSIEREKLLAEGITKQNCAMRCLLRGTNIRGDLKEEAFRALNDSDELCDKAKK